MSKIIGFAIIAMGIATTLLAGTPSPEIDPSTGVAALALLAGGVLVLRGRRAKQ